MIAAFALIATLAQTCAPDVAPTTLASIVRVESGFNPLAIGASGVVRLKRPPRTAAEAVQVARRLIRRGVPVDLGLAQINSRNLKALHLSLEEAFEPCANLRAAALLLTQNYRQARAHASPQRALREALSRYNTGSPSRGFANGYVHRVEAAARSLPPALIAAPDPRSPDLPPGAAPARAAPAWDVFAAASRPAPSPLLVFAQEG